MKLYALLGLASAAVAIPAFYQGSSVSLQPTTPGTADVGNFNVSGRGIAGSFVANSATTARADAAILGNSTGATGDVSGVRGQTSSTTGRGVTGIATATSGVNYGGYFESASAGGSAVRGVNTSSSNQGVGVYGFSNVGVGTVGAGAAGGIQGVGTGVGAYGVWGYASSQTGATWGVYGQCNSVDGKAVYGKSSATTGTNYGGYFANASTSGFGVLATATATTGVTTGVYGQSSSTAGRGVYGRTTTDSGTTYGGYFLSSSTSGRGVYGWVNAATGAIYGVYGRASVNLTSYGVYALGNSGASGTKSFRIDHPSDPENKYLMHYSAESPMPQNFYVGNVVTDAKGFAWVELPDYFQQINTNFKYQLTVVGKSFAQAVVWEKIQGNRFQIRTNQPNVEVSWEVKADRNDEFVKRSRPKDVVNKDEQEKGTYQHPELFGMPAERGLDYDPEIERSTKQPAEETKSRKR